jgi:hypothetical protein
MPGELVTVTSRPGQVTASGAVPRQRHEPLLPGSDSGVLAGWLTAIRDHPQRPSAAQVVVLAMLALRIGWPDGDGTASVEDLAGEADASEATVKRALAWAQSAGLLSRLRRGGRVGDGTASASQWRLILPPQRTGDLLREILAASPAPRAEHGGAGSQIELAVIVARVKTVLQWFTAETVTIAHAEDAVRRKLAGRAVRDPQRYLLASVVSDPGWWLPAPRPAARRLPQCTPDCKARKHGQNGQRQ